MYTYQDLLAAGGSLDARTTFINNAIDEHTGSKAYRTAADAELYYNGENPTISKYEKILYDCRARHTAICSRRITSSRPHSSAST